MAFGISRSQFAAARSSGRPYGCTFGAIEGLGGQFPKTLAIVLGEMAEIGETAIKGDVRDRRGLVGHHQHASRMTQPDLLDEHHWRVSTARLEEMKNAARACSGRDCERLDGNRLIPMSL